MAEEITTCYMKLEPPEEPTGWGVAFKVTPTSGRADIYLTTTVALKDCVGKDGKALSQEDILQVAWYQVKDEARARLTAENAKSPLIGTKFVENVEKQAAIDAAKNK